MVIVAAQVAQLRQESERLATNKPLKCGADFRCKACHRREL